MSSQNPKPTPTAGSKVPASALAKARPLGSAAAAAGAAGGSEPAAAAALATASSPRTAGAPVVLKGSASEAGRNLALGVLAVLIAVPMAGVAFWCAPREAFVAICASVLVSLLLFLAMQFRLLLQRNGVFLLLSCGLVLTLAVPICVRLMVAGSEWAQTLADFRRIQPSVTGSSAPGGAGSQTNGNVSPTQTSPATGAPLGNSGAMGGAPGAAPVPADAPGAASGTVAQKQEPDAQGSKSAPPSPVSVAESEVSGNEDPVQRATRLAKDEAVRRYPALQNPGSPENAVYLEAYNELTRLRKFDFFKDPKWPLNLAEIVGLREGWKREDQKPKAFKPSPNAAPLPGSEIALDGPQASAKASSDEVKMPRDSKVQAAPVASDPEEQAVSQATAEARRRYPAVGVEGSPENRAYLEAYQDLDGRRPDFFETPDWPIRLVELVAKREGWKRAAPDSPAPAASGRPPAGNRELPLPR